MREIIREKKQKKPQTHNFFFLPPVWKRRRIPFFPHRKHFSFPLYLTEITDLSRHALAGTNPAVLSARESSRSVWRVCTGLSPSRRSFISDFPLGFSKWGAGSALQPPCAQTKALKEPLKPKEERPSSFLRFRGEY